MAQCTAKSKQSGERCKRHASPGSNVCTMHGSKGGFTTKSLKHGKYSKSLPLRLATRFEEVANNPEISSMRYELALLDTMIDDHVAAMDALGVPELWKQARKDYQLIPMGGDIAKQAFVRLGELLERGQAEFEREKKICNLIQQRNFVAATEVKRDAALLAHLDAREANLLVAALLAAVMEEVVDQRTKDRIADRFKVLVHRENPHGPA